MKVFLGGTCNGSKWREELIPKLNINYFNPVVEDWDEKAKLNEIHQKEICDICLYVITPKMIGAYAIAEVTDDSNKKPEKTILCILDEDEGEVWSESQKSSLESIKKLIQSNGSIVFNSLEETSDYLNNK